MEGGGGGGGVTTTTGIALGEDGFFLSGKLWAFSLVWSADNDWDRARQLLLETAASSAVMNFLARIFFPLFFFRALDMEKVYSSVPPSAGFAMTAIPSPDIVFFRQYPPEMLWQRLSPRRAALTCIATVTYESRRCGMWKDHMRKFLRRSDRINPNREWTLNERS